MVANIEESVPLCFIIGKKSSVSGGILKSQVGVNFNKYLYDYKGFIFILFLDY